MNRNPELKAQTKQIIREANGFANRNNAMRREAFNKFEQLIGALPVAEQYRFFDNMSRGERQVDDLFSAVDPKFLDTWQAKHGPVMNPNDVAEAIRGGYDSARDRYSTASGNLQDFIVNYVSGMWENQSKGRSFGEQWTASRPIAGSSDFLKQKVYEYFGDGLKAGLQPVTTNPVRNMLMITERLERATAAHTMMNDFADSGLIHWYERGEVPPKGHAVLNDRTSQGNGAYWGPKVMADVYNNFVSQGLAGRVPLYDAIRSINGVQNALNLTMSAFHATATTVQSYLTAITTGIKQVQNGNFIKGGVNFAKAATVLGPVMEDFYRGNKVLPYYKDVMHGMDLGSPRANLDYAEAANDLEKANANVDTNPLFELQQAQKLKEAWKVATDDLRPGADRAKAAVKAAGNVLGVATEGMLWPIQKLLVPRVKIGAFYRTASEIHDSMSGATEDDLNRALGKAWDSIDNRFGQVNHDNWFTHRVTKDIAQITLRSPGYTLGTARELGGGVLDLGGSVKDAVQGNGFKLTNRSAYVGAMVMGTMYMNGIYSYMHTGQMPNGLDYLFPRDGSKNPDGTENRVYPKNYFYDAYNFVHDPVHTVLHKSAPLISTVDDVVENQDYYHRVIRDPGDSLPKQAASTLGFLASQFMPFTVQNAGENNLRGDSKFIQSFMGIQPAPQWAGRSKAENLASTYFNGTQGASMDERTWENKKSFLQLRNQYAAGKLTDEQLGQAIQSGKLNPRMVKYLYDTHQQPNIVKWTARLQSADETWKVWQAASPQEKKQLYITVLNKIAKSNMDEEQQRRMQELSDFQQ